MKKMTGGEAVKLFCVRNAVPIVFLLVSAFGIYYSQFTAAYLIQEMLTRLARNAFLVLSLLIPIMAGMGLNFGMVLGAMAGQIGLIFISDWNVSGLYGMTLAALIATPLAMLFGWMCGVVLNKARGREMVTSYILGFFMNGVYQLVVLYGFGSVVPILNPELVLSRGYGIRNVTNLDGIRNTLDNAIEALPPDRTIKAEIADDGTTLFFSVSNRYDNKIERAPDGSFISSKADKKNHGLGMKNIQQAVERLNGRITITTDSGIFRVYAEIPLAKQLR